MKNTKCCYGQQPQPLELGAAKIGEAVAALYLCGCEPFKTTRRPVEAVTVQQIARRASDWADFRVNEADVRAGLAIARKVKRQLRVPYSIRTQAVYVRGERCVVVLMPRGAWASPPWWLGGSRAGAA